MCVFFNFRALNFVDFNAPETRNAFNNQLQTKWSEYEKKIDDIVNLLRYNGTKQIIDENCGSSALYLSYFAMFIMHTIGTHNLTLLTSLQTQHMTNLSKEPFTIRKTAREIYNLLIIPSNKNIEAFYQNIKNG